MTEREQLHIAGAIEDIMDAAEPIESKSGGVSINIHAPCTNRIASGDYIEVNLYLPSESPEATADAIESAVRVARSMRPVEARS